jgi:hypothetical protein
MLISQTTFTHNFCQDVSADLFHPPQVRLYDTPSKVDVVYTQPKQASHCSPILTSYGRTQESSTCKAIRIRAPKVRQTLIVFLVYVVGKAVHEMCGRGPDDLRHHSAKVFTSRGIFGFFRQDFHGRNERGILDIVVDVERFFDAGEGYL